MSELIYVDTNVWLDYFLNRKDALRPLGDFAFELFRKSADCSYRIVVSGLVIKELEHHISESDVAEMFSWLQSLGKLTSVDYVHEDKRRAKQHKHWQDALHAILAQKAQVTYLVTRNVKDFPSNFSFQVVLPEQLI